MHELLLLSELTGHIKMKNSILFHSIFLIRKGIFAASYLRKTHGLSGSLWIVKRDGFSLLATLKVGTKNKLQMNSIYVKIIENIYIFMPESENIMWVEPNSLYNHKELPFNVIAPASLRASFCLSFVSDIVRSLSSLPWLPPYLFVTEHVP